MKKRLPASFDDLLKHHYGSGRDVMLSNTAKAQRLIANYYGKPLRRGKKRNCLPTVPAVTMSYDTGEVLPQRQADPEPFEQYVVSRSLSDDSFEEYVLGDVATEAPVSVASSLQIPRAEEVNASQECDVDILQTCCGSNSSYAQPSRSPQPNYATGNERRALPPATAQSFSAPVDTARAKPDEDDFVKDMEAILSGQMLYDRASKTTKPRDAVNRAPQPEQPPPPQPNEQAIFDRIAQSMEYANKYDLGTLELENRFSDFDRISELQDKAKRDAKLKKSQKTSSIPTVNPTVDSTDFLHDLDAIKRQQSATTAAPAAVGYGQSMGVPAAAAFTEPIQTVCGFFGPNSVVLTEQNLRDGVRAVALEEHQAWFDTTTGNAKSETELGQFGQLVFYTLGRESAILPTTLTAAQAVAISGGVNYNVLWNAGSTAAQVNTAIPQVRTALLTGAPNPGNPPNLNNLVDQALRNARSSRLDSFAWSSVFVCTCVRRMAIQLGIEGEVSGTHVGRDELLLAHEAHRVYVIEAYSRRFGPNQKDGTYHAFRIDERAPQVGDIIVQDRQANNIAGVVTFDEIPTALPGGRNMHGDIVIEVNATDVVTVGGNLSGGVRRRRFPLDANGRLVMAREQLFTQEANNGTLAAVPMVNNAAGLHGQSTGRLVTLLSLVQVCAAVPGQPMNGGILT